MHLLVLAGCAEELRSTKDAGGDERERPGETGDSECRLVATPESVDFGAVAVDATSTKVVTLANEGTEESCQIEGLGFVLDADAGAFALSAIGSVLIPAGASTNFDVSFTPPEVGDFEATVRLEYDNDEILLPLTGSGTGTALSIEPDGFDFGTEFIGCSERAELVLANHGDVAAEIESVAFETATSELTASLREEPPFTLGAGESVALTVWYKPLDELPDTATWRVESAAQAPVSAPVSATGLSLGWHGDRFEVGPAAADFVFIVDSTGSMAEERGRLGAAGTAFEGALEHVDFQVALLTPGDRNFVGEVLTDDTEDFATEFAAQELSVSGGSGAGLETARQSLQAGGDAEEFLRDDATLVIVFVTDESDQSPGAWSDYVADFEAVKEAVVLHAIAGDYPSGCATADSAGVGYYEAVTAMGGLYLSVCDPTYDAHLTDIAAAVGISSYELTHVAVEGTVSVTVDGVAVTTGWTYDAYENIVSFETSPDAGAIVEISYAARGEC